MEAHRREILTHQYQFVFLAEEVASDHANHTLCGEAQHKQDPKVVGEAPRKEVTSDKKEEQTARAYAGKEDQAAPGDAGQYDGHCM